MQISLKQVRYFLAACDSGKVSLAAKELFVSQSAVTTAIQQLEQTLGVTLLERQPSGVRLTAEGARFVRHARSIMAAVDNALHSPLRQDVSEAGQVRVGVTYTVGGYFLPRHYASFHRAYPNIQIEMREMDREQIEAGLINGELDLAVMLVSNLGNRKQIDFETLLRSRRRLWLPSDHELLEADSVTLADVSKYKYVMLTVDEANATAAKYWSGTGHVPDTLFSTSSVEAVRSMVAAGMGVTVLSDMVYRPWSLEGQRIETRELDENIPTMDVGLAWRHGTRPTGPARTFFDYLALVFGGAHHGLGD